MISLESQLDVVALNCACSTGASDDRAATGPGSILKPARRPALLVQTVF